MVKEERLKKDIVQELIKKYDIDIVKLEKEQEKLAKQLEIKDSRDFDEIQIVAGVDSAFIDNKIISGIVLLDDNLESVERDYSIDKLRFPYIPGFRAYRELKTMVDAIQRLDEKPDLVFIRGHGTSHPRVGIASHFSLSTGIPTIGIAEKLLEGEVKGDDIVLSGKVVGKVLQGKEGSKPLYISPGNLISIGTALELTKKFIKFPHKLPEPLHSAHKYAKKVRDELR